MSKTIVISLGGSLIVPDNIDIQFLREFKIIIEKFLKKRFRFVIICGGGKLARNLQQAASKIANAKNEDLDWLGIYATRSNAVLVRGIFNEYANESIISNPNEKISSNKSIIVASGWKPGFSTDYDAVLLAKNLGINEVVNMSNVDYVYDKDPKKYKNAKKIERIKWDKFRKLISSKWKAGMNVPFDPVAAKEAQKSKIKVKIIGSGLKNLENLLSGKKFKGTVIE